MGFPFQQNNETNHPHPSDLHPSRVTCSPTLLASRLWLNKPGKSRPLGSRTGSKICSEWAAATRFPFWAGRAGRPRCAKEFYLHLMPVVQPGEMRGFIVLSPAHWTLKPCPWQLFFNIFLKWFLDVSWKRPQIQPSSNSPNGHPKHVRPSLVQVLLSLAHELSQLRAAHERLQAQQAQQAQAKQAAVGDGVLAGVGVGGCLYA